VKIPYTYAAPCAKPFSGDNGGATADGVTKDSIKIVVYQADPSKDALAAATVRGSGADVSPASARTTYQGYFDMYEKYYNFYGRKLDVVFFPGTGAPDDEVTARSDADAIADMHPFAVMSGPNRTPVWAQELAARHVMCVGNCSLAVPQKTIEEASQYLYGVGQTPEQAGLMTAKFVTTNLAGKKAVYGGDAVKDKTRVFGVAHYISRMSRYLTLHPGDDDSGIVFQRIGTDGSIAARRDRNQGPAPVSGRWSDGRRRDHRTLRESLVEKTTPDSWFAAFTDPKVSIGVGC